MYYIKIKVDLITLKFQCRYNSINKVSMIILLVVVLLNLIDGRIVTKRQNSITKCAITISNNNKLISSMCP